MQYGSFVVQYTTTLLFFFFFQAEDGIRDLTVTGVQTCALPIYVVVGVAAVISVLVILLAMYTTVTERTRQIGVLKSLGMSNASVAWVIEQEALIVSVLGVLFGIVLTLLARFVVMRATSLTVDIEPRWPSSRSSSASSAARSARSTRHCAPRARKIGRASCRERV